jgi:hypothetical protein
MLYITNQIGFDIISIAQERAFGRDTSSKSKG